MALLKSLVLLALLPVVAAAQVANPAVMQDNIQQTICVSGWTKTVRPSLARLKRAYLHQAGLPSSDAALYELDHVIPIEVGGAPRDPNNLQLQKWDGPNGAHTKDVVENRIHRAVCTGRMTLAAGRACFVQGWQTCP